MDDVHVYEDPNKMYEDLSEWLKTLKPPL
jgi:hypothetical protein